MKVARLFGLNYAQCESGELRGCHNDITNFKRFLTNECGYSQENVHAFNDQEHKEQTCKQGLLINLDNLAKKTWKEDISECIISYSGHGAQVKDYSGDETDGCDECLVPWDYASNGVILDDTLRGIFCEFNPKTRVIFICDACHSGSMSDARYQYFTNLAGNFNKVENQTYYEFPCDFISISGCRDKQTSADAYNVNSQLKYTGALTSCLLQVLEKNKNLQLKYVMAELNCLLHEKGFKQKPVVSSSKELTGEEKLFS